MKVRLILLLSILLLATGTLAGNWHVAGSLDCGECHLQHGSNQRDPTVEGSFAFLLRKSSVNELCLSCHDGTDPTAPDVVIPTPMYSATTSKESAAGVLTMVGLDNPNGHSLGLELSTPLKQEPALQNLSCVSCHSAHGNGNYRNLLADPAATGAVIPVQEGTAVFQGVQPDDPPSTAGSIAAYNRDNVGYGAGMTSWCLSCHDQLSSNSVAAAPAHFNAHPSEIALNAFPYETHVDLGHWLAGTGEGFASVGQSPAVARVPFVASTATDFPSSKIAAADNKVSCLSCHKAHGSSNRKGMVWPYLEEDENSLAGCQQCHNK